MKRIILTGYVADQDMAALYSGALVFVYPSLRATTRSNAVWYSVITSNTSSLQLLVMPDYA